MRVRRELVAVGAATLALLALLTALSTPPTAPPSLPYASAGASRAEASSGGTGTAGTPRVAPAATWSPSSSTPWVPAPNGPVATPTSTLRVFPKKPASGSGTWTLTFADEFDGSELDHSSWNTRFWWGRERENELEYYTDDSVTLADGALRLRADRKSVEGYRYTSGVVTTQGKFAQAYGFFEMRARVPFGNGLWPALWLLPEAGHTTIWPPEVDVIEFMGGQPRTAFMNYHYVDSSTPHGQQSKGFDGPDFTQDFHTYGLDWTPEALTWYIDGVQRHRVRQDIPTLPMYVIANLAIGDWGGQPDRSTPFPSDFLIDYIRVWQSSDPSASR